jgi:cytoskeletal protein CcmA (bactofilin family)
LTEQPDSESIVIDPVAMHIVNRVAAGCRQSGSFHCKGGLMVEGRVEGEIEVVDGPLVLMPEGFIAGKIKAHAEAYLFGTVGPRSDTQLSELEVHGAVFLAETLRAEADITAGAIRSYEGAQVEGRIRTVKRSA